MSNCVSCKKPGNCYYHHSQTYVNRMTKVSHSKRVVEMQNMWLVVCGRLFLYIEQKPEIAEMAAMSRQVIFGILKTN